MTKIEFLKDAIELNKHLHELSNLKSGVILVVAGLLFSGIAEMPDEVKDSTLYKTGFIIMLSALIISILFVLISVYPRYGNRNTKNLLYFMDILELVDQKENTTEEDSEVYLKAIKNYEEIYSIEVVGFSKTLKDEYFWQAWSLRFLFLLIPGLICVAIAYVMA